AVGADRVFRVRVEAASAVPLVPCAVHAYPLGGPGQAVVDEDVGYPIRVSAHEVRGVRPEDAEAAVRADRGPVATAVRLVPGAVHAHALGGLSQAVADEHVPTPVAVAGHEVGGERDKGDEAAVGADRRARALAVGLAPGAVHAHPLGGAGQAAVAVHVIRPAC